MQYVMHAHKSFGECEKRYSSERNETKKCGEKAETKMLDHVHGTDIAEICTWFPYL